MPTKSTKQLSQAQRDMLLLLADRPGLTSGVTALVSSNRCFRGIITPYADEVRTVKALCARGLVRWVYPGHMPGIPRSGITLTQKGADILSPPATVTYPE